MKKSVFIFLPVLVTMWLVSTSCGDQPGASTPAATLSQQSQSLHEIEVTRVLSQKLSTSVRLPAQLAAYEAVDVYPKVTGFVKQIRVDRGSRVKKGELIAQLEAPELVAQRGEAGSKYQSAESQLLGTQAKLASDEATFKRMSAASKVPGVIAGNDLDIAQKTVQADQANVAALQKNVQAARDALRAVAQLENYLNIAAPFDGQVTARYVHPGALVGPAGGPGGSSPMLRIETTTLLRLVVPVPEYDAAGVPEGTQVSFSVPSFPGRSFRAPIARISHSVDVKTRTMPVELDVRDPRGELVPGSFCEVEWPVRRNYPTLFVPASAVSSDLARTFVVRVQSNRAEWVDVKTGASAGGFIEVFGDLHAGDEVVLHGTDQIKTGDSVTPLFTGAQKK
jgi:membrane fusion protein, multidrug efflux system